MFHGSMVALVTPMDADGAVDYTAFERLLDFHIDSGTDALVVCGTTGESATLAMEEQGRLIRHAVTYVHERVPVIAGSGAASTRQTIALTRQAMETGADAALVVTPYYNKPTQEGLYRHHRAVAEAVPIPQILYNVPGRTACDMQPETAARLAEVSNIVGIKEATASLERARAIRALAGESLDVYSGDDPTARELMLDGAQGVISVTANAAPLRMKRMCDAATSGDADTAARLDAGLEQLHKALFVESNPIPVKWALHEMGLIGAGIRLPLTSLSAEWHDTVRAALEELNVD